ncbi:hypothetical protein AB1286_29865 [Trinickia sp. NRRL B-1857]|uniref:hypothetical protein n=1 Tax=Trinickia sp. NRRL B-1857 TaxID=3162879 RepID=UPI003D27CB62
MKRILVALITLASSVAFAATTVPIQLLNPTGSSSGQAIVSIGASSAPVWGSVGAGAIAGTTQYDVAVGTGSGLGFISPGTSGYVFGSNGTSAYPSFQSLTSLGIATAGANANITSLTGLTTPLGTWGGGLGANNSSANGVPVFSSGTATVTATTGTGAPVLATSPTITTPAIVGPTNGTAAAAGNVGEVICAQVTNGGSPTGCATNSSTPVSLTTSGNTYNVTSIMLTPGNWLVWGQVLTIPAGTTTQSSVAGGINSTSASFTGVAAEFVLPFSAGAGQAVGGALHPMPIRVTTNTTYYLVVNAAFAVSTNTAIGYIAAQRTN